MAKRIVVLSGAVSSGKTTLAQDLEVRFGAVIFKTAQLLRACFPAANDRRELQEAGERLDRVTGGRWVADQVGLEIAKLPADSLVVLDAVRIASQLDFLRLAFGSQLVHLHLTAPVEILAKRYNKRKSAITELASYEEVRRSDTERQVENLAGISDFVINTHRSTPPDVLVRAASCVGLYSSCSTKLVDVLVGGEYGSEGKGNIASYLAKEYDVLVRVGGPNAGHKVFLDSGKTFTHHHLPSGTLSSNARLIIGPGAVLHVPSLLDEIAACGVRIDRLSIDPQAMIISDEDIAKERELVKGIGSTGRGVGAATARKISARHDPPILARDVQELKPFIAEALDILERAYAKDQKIMLEGTQGTGLSLHHGSYPYVTSRDTTVSGCLAEAGISATRVRRVVIVCRTYPIRVQSPQGGTSGPMGKEITLKEIARRSGLPYRRLQKAEITSTTGRRRRFAEFNWELLRKSASLNGATDIALTFVDYIDAKNEQARRFEQLTGPTIYFIEEVERVGQAPVTLISTRFHSRSIIDRRLW